MLRKVGHEVYEFDLFKTSTGGGYSEIIFKEDLQNFKNGCFISRLKRKYVRVSKYLD